MQRSLPDLAQFCDRCRDLCGTEEGLRAACSSRGYPHWTSKSELQSKAETCKLCKLVWEARYWKKASFISPLHTYAYVNQDRDSHSEEATSGNGRGGSEIDAFHVRTSLADPPTVLLRLLFSTREGEQNVPAISSKFGLEFDESR